MKITSRIFIFDAHGPKLLGIVWMGSQVYIGLLLVRLEIEIRRVTTL